ncbi:MAG TPA: hypothetical protein V6C86_20825 [Oculatellaceae cyanobacterium]
MKLELQSLCLALVVALSVVGSVPITAPAQGQQTPIAKIKSWFAKYDDIRRQAQMNPTERAKADTLLAKGISIVMPGADKVESAQLFQVLESKNSQAADQMKQLALYPETADLHKGYFKYFSDAASLFGDYLRVQNNIMTTDPVTGKPLMGQLLNRKKNLEDLDAANKAMDADLRNQFGIPPYRY